MKKIIFTAVCLAAFIGAEATHIVGGFISYRFISGSTYEIKMSIYRDCTSATPFDSSAAMGLFFETSGNLVNTFAFTNSVITTIQPPIDNPCLVVPPNVCVEQGVYTATIDLPSATDGYTLVYERCCRNGTITNVFDPGSQGAVYSAYIPPSNTFHNSSPVFTSLPPMFICVNSPLILNYSATDADGDVLVYNLCTPFTGGSTIAPAPNPPVGPPFVEIDWEQPFSLADLLGGVPLTIDQNTGVLTGTPNTIGQFVVGVCVSEYRNGQLIGTYLRDGQFNVTQCNVPVAGIPSTDINPNTQIGTYVINCSNLHVQFVNTSYNPPPASVPMTYEWDFGVNGITTDVSTQAVPFYDYPDTGTYFVRLIATKGTGANACIDTTYAYVYIYPTHTAEFTTADVCQGVIANFTDQSISTVGNINSWNWNFGDGSGSTQTNPTHLYSTYGTFQVTLIGGNDLHCKDTITKPITIFPTPTADFSYGSTCINTVVSFIDITSGSANSYSWNLGNGNNSAQQNPSTTYISIGDYDVTLIAANNGCPDTITKTLTVHPVPVVANNDTGICPGQSVQLFAGGGSVYTWSPSTGLSDSTSVNPLATPNTSSTYSVSATTQFNCTASDVVNITVFALPNVVASPDTSVCLSGANFKDSVQLNASGAVNYLWSPANTLNSSLAQNPIARPLANTTYFVQGTDVNGCRAIDSVTVYVLDPSINIILDDTKNVCLFDTTYANVTSQGASNYVWTPLQFLLNASSYSPGFYPTINTTYTLTVSNYCYSKSDSVLIVVLQPPVLSFTHSDSICIYDTLQITVSGAQDYQWNFDSTLSALNISNPFANPTTSQFYYVSAVDLNGCKNTDSTFVTVVPLPTVNAGNDTLIWRDTKAYLDGSTDASKYFWSPVTFLSNSKSLQTTAAITAPQYYVLSVENDFGCVNSDTIFITLETNNILLVPTAFSPNGDGVNDVFRILRYLNIYKLKEFSVWNRWGEKVFATTDLNEGWNGTFRNHEQELGVYSWQIIAETKDSEEIVRKGNVTLVR